MFLGAELWEAENGEHLHNIDSSMKFSRDYTSLVRKEIDFKLNIFLNYQYKRLRDFSNV